MRDLFKKTAILFLCLILTGGFFSPLLVVRADDTSSSTASSSVPTPPGILTPKDQALAQGTEACQKATALAIKFGGFTALDATFSGGIQKTVLDGVTNFLKNQIKKDTGISLDFNDLKNKAFTAGGEFIQSQFDGLIGNPLRDATSKASKELIDAAKKEAEEIAKKYLGDIAKGITNILDVDAAVPISSKQLDVVNQSINNVIAEQKRSELIQDTRDKCNNLLNKTVSAIKKAFLYQLSSQIVDWVQNGKTPQFWSRPGQFLEDTGRLALDRFISRVAPQLCQPFQFAIQVQIPTVDRQANPFYEQVSCTLDQAKNNIENFYRDFRQGGWITYQEMWKPQNNYYGALLMTRDAAAQTVAAATQAAQQDVAQGRGFASQYRCIAWTKYVQSLPNEVELSQGGVGYSAADTAGPTTDGGPPESGLTQDQSRPDQFWNSKRDYFWQCEQKEKTSPGSVAATLNERASTVDIDYLTNSNDIENFLQTIQDSIVNKIVKSGVNGLKVLLPKWLPPLK